jgi:hypothetical protein
VVQGRHHSSESLLPGEAVQDAEHAGSSGSQCGGFTRGGVGEDPRHGHAHVPVGRQLGLLLGQSSLVGRGEDRLEGRYYEVFLSIKMADQDLSERGGTVDQVPVGVVPERWGSLVSPT